MQWAIIMANKDISCIIRPMYDFIDIKYNLKEYDRELSVDLHQFLDFIVWWSLNGISNLNNKSRLRFKLSPKDYFKIKDIKKPGSKDYEEFYRYFERLSFVVLDISRRAVDVKAKMRSTIITNLAIFEDVNDRRKVCVMYELNNVLMDYFKWIGRNLAQNIFISIKLKKKYAYKLYLYILRRAIEANGVIHVSYDELGRRVGRRAGEENKEFNRCLRAAVNEINKVGDIYNYHNFEILIDRKHNNDVTIRILGFGKIRKAGNINGTESKRRRIN